MSEGATALCIILGVTTLFGVAGFLVISDFLPDVKKAGSFGKYRALKKAQAKLQRLKADLEIDQINARCANVEREIDEKRLKAYEEAIKSYEAATKGDA